MGADAYVRLILKHLCDIKEAMRDSLWVWGRKGNPVQHSKCTHIPGPQVKGRNLRVDVAPLGAGFPSVLAFLLLRALWAAVPINAQWHLTLMSYRMEPCPCGCPAPDSIPCLLLKTQKLLHRHMGFLLQDINTGSTDDEALAIR